MEGLNMNNNSMNSQSILNIQKYLRTLSFFDKYKDIPPIAVDGVYGQETRNAVIAYQKLKNISQSGKVDRQTFNTLYKDYLSVLNYEKARTPYFNFPRYPRNFEFREGYRGFYIYLIKYLLNELQKNRDTYNEFELNDDYDEELSQAIREIQKTYLLPETGNVDALTWNSIISEYNQNQLNLLE